MATILLSAAGSAAGGALGGSLGVAALGATLGRAAGAIAGGLIDQKLLGGRSAARDVGGPAPQIMSAREGAPIGRIYGRYRVPGTVIWSSRFRQRIEGGGGKSGRPARSRYSISLALGLCEGPVDRIGRIWADGKPLATGRLQLRLHRGDEAAQPDPLIAATEGANHVPAYRGLAYLVIEELDLAPFGNRIPQLHVEVFRQPKSQTTPLRDLVRGVAMSPGSGEFSLNTRPVRRVLRPGVAQSENVNNIEGRPDLLVSLDQLRDEAPNCRAASLIVSWFGDDLRCGACRLMPKLEQRDKRTEPVAWSVSGLGREHAPLVSRDARGRPAFGGTPDDRGVIEAIREMRGRGLSVMFYPFILMDIPAGNGRPDPYGADEQAAFPWRGRMTLSIAAGREGSPDQSAAAEEEVVRFFGAADAADFSVADGRVAYSGPAEWSLRRMVLHNAALCAAAGGVDAFCIGSELRGLTSIRSARTRYPAVEELRRLARDVRRILGEETKIGYAADWSEYFGHHPGDGSGDVLFHLDPLWSDPEIDFIGIDNYAPLTDWRDGEGHLDRKDARAIYDLAYLSSRIEGGEGYDWHYASLEDRRAQIRTPISDTAHGEHWIFRPKDFHGWWSNPHHDRIGGVRETTPTAWRAGSKPIWFTEIGCAAIDKSANQPNVFLDPKSSESATPHFSSGARDDHMQRRFLEANLRYWSDPAHNPPGQTYSGRMIDVSRCFVWTWDARPWPDFPQRREVWGDWLNHRAGHWITGRLGAADLADMVREICAEAGLSRIDVEDLDGALDGFAQLHTQPPRAALESLAMVAGFDVVESGGRVLFSSRHRARASLLPPADLAAPDDAVEPVEIVRDGAEAQPGAIRFGWIDSTGGYAPATVQTRNPGAAQVDAADAPVAISPDYARGVIERWRGELNAAQESARFTLTDDHLHLEPGDLVRLGDDGLFRIVQIADAEQRRAEATRAAAAPPLLRRVSVDRSVPPPPVATLHPPAVAAVETWPGPDGDPGGLRIFAFADPWPGRVGVQHALAGGGFGFDGAIDRPAVMGALAAPLEQGPRDRWDRGGALLVDLFGGDLRSVAPEDVLAGANCATVQAVDGGWMSLQFQTAELIAPRRWRLSGLLRGRSGGAARADIGARFVFLDDAGYRPDADLGAIGAPQRFRVGPISAPVEHDSQVDLEVLCAGLSASPAAPSHLQARRSGGDLHLSWLACAPRDRGFWTDTGEDVPTRSFVVSALREGVLALRETVIGCAWSIPGERAAAAGLDGPFDLHVAEISAGFGVGPETRITING